MAECVVNVRDIHCSVSKGLCDSGHGYVCNSSTNHITLRVVLVCVSISEPVTDFPSMQ